MVRRSGDTKTRKSRRTLALPSRCIDALWRQDEDQGWDRLAAGDDGEEHGLVFSSAVGKPLDAANIRRALRQALKDVDGVDAAEWTPRELRHSFVSLLSDRGVPLEEISRQAGDPDGCRRHGRHLRRGPTEAVGTQEAIVTQIDTQQRQRALTESVGAL
ncbi:Phage integrase family protein [Streptomyces sp. PTY087I2]|nr:Phage integrase family protein [Streptomyces sp. PTY087I2]